MTKNNKPGCLTPFLRRFQKSPEPQKLPYLVRDDFLSAAEASFFRLLKTAVGESLVIFPKVSLADIFYVSHPEINQPYFNKINQKHVDFLLCSPATLKPVLAIELDDASHQRPDRIERDEFVDQVFSTAGLRLLHIPVQRAYNTQDLQALLQGAFKNRPQPSVPDRSVSAAQPSVQEPPFCTKCGARMVLKTARKGSYAGQQFYACPNYPKCQNIIPLETKQGAGTAGGD